MMKKITTCTLCARDDWHASSGRIRIMAAPVVPTTLAMPRAEGKDAGIDAGVPRRSPVTRMPPATV
jgi:hypothetical protein